MAHRQDSGSNSSHENQQPNAHNEDRLPENTDNVRGLGEDDEAGLDIDEDDDDLEMEEDDEDEGTV